MKLKLCAVLLTILVVASCNSRPDYSKLTRPIEEAASATESIREDAKTIEAIVPPEVLPTIKPHTESIQTHSELIDKSLDKAQSAIVKLEKEVEAERDGSQKLLRKTIAITTFASAVSAAVLIGLFCFGHIKSFVGIIISLSVLGACIALTVMLSYLVWIAAALGLLVAGVIVWYVLKHRKAQRELVQTVEAIKPGVENFAETANKIQHPFTKSVVNRVQKKLTSAPKSS